MPSFPLWLRWTLSLVVAAVLLGGLVRFVQRNNGNGLAAPNSAAAEQRANQEGRIVTAQDQAPHHARFRRSMRPVEAVERAISSDVHALVSSGDLQGPFQHVSCRRIATAPGGRIGYRCDARAGGFRYPFLGVVDIPARDVVFCKDDSISVDAGVQAPLSPRCRA